MPIPSARPISNARLLLVYAAALLILAMVMTVIYTLLDAWFGFSTQSAGMGLLLPLISGMVVGQNWYGHERARPGTRRAFVVALLCALVTMAAQLGAFFLVTNTVAGIGATPLPLLMEQDPAVTVLLFSGLFAIGLVLIRLGIGMGVGQGIRQEERRAAIEARKDD